MFKISRTRIWSICDSLKNLCELSTQYCITWLSNCFSPLLPIGQERHAQGLLHHHLGVVLPLHSARLRHHEQKNLFRLDQSLTVSLLEALSAKESSHSCTVCAHVSQCGVTQSRRLYAGRLESKLCARWQLGLAGWWLCTRGQLGRLVAATCLCSRPPSTASLRLLWSPGTDPSTHVYTLRVPKHRRSPLLASRMQNAVN